MMPRLASCLVRSACALAALGLLACGDEFEDDGTPCSPGNMYSLTDDFEDGDLDPLWVHHGAVGTAAEQNGRLELSLPALAGGPMGTLVSSAQSYDLRGCYFAFELPEAPADAANPVQFGMNVGVDAENFIGMAVWGPGMYAALRVDDVDTHERDANFDPSFDRYWRIREQDGTVFFETSGDGTAWTELLQAPTPSYANSVVADFVMIALTSLPNPQLAAFDNVNRLP